MNSVAGNNGLSWTRNLLRVIVAVICLVMAMRLAQHGATGLAASGFMSDRWTPLVTQAMLVFLLLLGYAGLGAILDRQVAPISTQGLPLRKDWKTEAGMGIATGWSIAVIAVTPLALIGGIAIHLDPTWDSWKWLLVDAGFFALFALAEEIGFRGYGFQRLVEALGALPATILFTVLYVEFQAALPGTTRVSIAVSAVLSLLLSMAYLRTRALWVGWGLNFGWKASRALLFGLAVNGETNHSPVVTGDPMGPFWLTGGGFGLDASWWAFWLLLLAMPVVYRFTRDLNFVYNAPLLRPSGIPVDLDAAGQRQHEAAMGPATPTDASPAKLVQIVAPEPGIPPPSTRSPE